jgi:eukaryotic-like serine/threonine-protein kinase
LGTGEAQPRAAELAVGRRWTFGPAVLDERTLELTVNGEPARVERKPLEVLLYLLHHAGEAVTKDELAENLWPGRILTETVLTRCISQLRQVLEDDERSVIRTVHGYGYRLVAEVKVDAAAGPAPPTFSFEAGQQPPLRPHWRLVERLGAGGHGEAWLAVQEKTRDQRVFKFALDAGGLAALKREITLYRLLNDTLGDRSPAVRLLEWNLEEAPYFIETEYVEGRDLSAWATAHRLAEMPLAQRLDLIAQVAEALAAAHSVGVLHKDLKPGNVLVRDGSDGPVVKLCDFGSGGVLDAERLEKLGITRMGFTKTASTATSATPLYVAPEVIAGQPSTVAADIYALGVMLYQIVVGDFRKALAPGWELDVPDDLLREDIAAAAAGDPARRLADASHVAERLRSLESRRRTRAIEGAERERIERARRALKELRRVRAYALLLLGVSAIGVGGGITAYKARNEALAATATAEAVSGFLTEDVLRVDSGLFKPSESTYEALLNRASAEVNARLRHQPKAAADIHWLLGRRYQEIGEFQPAAKEYETAIALFTDLYGEASEANLMALDRLAVIYLEIGRTAEA